MSGFRDHLEDDFRHSLYFERLCQAVVVDLKKADDARSEEVTNEYLARAQVEATLALAVAVRDFAEGQAAS